MPRIAVLGSGPAGFYATAALLRRNPAIRIDILESLPVPFGLVRYGVAPDHPHTKNATHGFADLLERSGGRVRFCGNLPAGPGAPLTDAHLAAAYDAVVHATGAAGPRTLHLDEALPDRVRVAHDFIFWLNGHPQYTGDGRPPPPLGPDVAVIGAGNVALDVARLLLRPVDELVATDISPRALDAIAAAQVQSVGVYARRGPEAASWTAAALREIVTKIPGIDTRFHRNTIARAREIAKSNIGRATARCLQILEQHAHDFAADLPSSSFGRNNRVLALNFLHTPTAFTTGENNSVTVKFWCGDLQHSASNSFDIVLLSLGYEGGQPKPGRISVGWANGKGKGIIGDSKVDADSVIARLSDEQLGLRRDAGVPAAPGIERWARDAGVQVVNWEGWLRIDAEERKRGRALHPDRERVKIERVDEMLAIAG
jgi:hypothetical protein